jgi:hypothetical protein
MNYKSLQYGAKFGDAIQQEQNLRPVALDSDCFKNITRFISIYSDRNF